MKRSALAPRSAKKLAETGTWSPYSTLTSKVGISRTARPDTTPATPKLEKIPLPRAPWRGLPEPVAASTVSAKKRPKDTGPTTSTRRKVKKRDKRCVRCGREVLHGRAGRDYSLQHILGRGAGGTNDPQVNDVDWLILVCGDGTSLCHGEIEAKYRTRAYADGHARKRTAIDRHLHTLVWHGRRCRLQGGKVLDATTGIEVSA